MTTTELIELLKRFEHGASGRSREVSFQIGEDYIFEPEIKFNSSGDGICGAELCLEIVPREDD